MITADEAINTLQRQFDDTDGEMFTRDRWLNFLQDGYDRLVRETEALFDIEMYDTQPRAANYTREFERQYIDGPIVGRFDCTRESDAQWCDGGAIVANHTRPYDAYYMTEEDKDPTFTGLRTLPEGYVSVDRVTHDWLRLDPEHDRYNRMTRTDYQTLQGGVFQYQMDQDGWRQLRLVNVPPYVVDETTYSYNPNTDTTNHHGVIRALTGDDNEFEDEAVIGTYGIIRSVPAHFVSGSQYGGIRRIISDDDNTRVEYYRLGKPLADHAFELPDRMVKYVQWWALYRAYSTPGESENKRLAEHFKLRFQMGIDRLKKRVRNVMRERTIAMGSKRNNIRDSYLEHFPAEYGYSRPFRR